ncbi:CIS tube protein [Actinacidiphila epipremni]|uniref:LysM peptidoglycan-binding domain-containing protein n=1 Tax=Actinacidiphila epipremni TaxID=2053013 RepID=A0ABX0ZYQ5_9ACTN|nr:LysM peptidoglycan-binding domain-containing protein [Actinacidiphila epipremni]NJP46553.1 LysM peptidoglycan-binding domain-containing protein [Actinacidiphila epipremni]
MPPSSPVAFSAASPGGSHSAGGPSGAGARPKLERAYLELRQPPPDGGTSTPGPQFATIDFQFNPKELSLAKSAKWERKTARGASRAGPAEYTGPEPSKLTLEMFFDATDDQGDSVVKSVEQLFSCCVPTDQTQDKKKGTPPFVIFHWGGLTGFVGFISQVQAKYTLFTAGGLPIRAVCQVTIEELASQLPGQNPTSGALTARRVHRVVAGDTLAMLAFREYGDPAAWRDIAEANGIDDPMRLAPGRDLLLPGADEITR